VGESLKGKFSSTGSLSKQRKRSRKAIQGIETGEKGRVREYPFLLLLASFLTEGRLNLAGVLFLSPVDLRRASILK